MLLSLEEHFNRIGLSLREAYSGKLLLCKVIDGIPVATKTFDDYIPIGKLTEELTDKAVDRIIGFVVENHTDHPVTIKKPKENNGNYGLYGSSFHDGINAEIEKQLINAIAEWMNE